jgi:ParB family chromosome partitioning protein
MPTLSDLPTDHLVPHERNIRSGVGDLSDLQASITAVGILQPLLVVPLPVDHPCAVTLDTDDGRPWFQIIIGHRRHAAAAALSLDTVPCLVAADEGEADKIVKMLSENVHRQGLSQIEEAEAYRQLALLDWTPEQISTVTAKPVSRVRDALTLVTLPRQVQAAADQGQLDLAEAVLLADFAEQPKVLDRLLARGKGWGLTHAVAEERAKRDRKDVAERLRAELVLAGVKVTPKPAGFGYESRECSAATLRDAHGDELDLDAVRTAAGFAAFVEAGHAEPHVVVYCTDPERYGYTRTRPTSYVSPQVAEQRAREAEERQAYAQGLLVATGVRREFLATTYGSARGAKTVHLEALRAAMTDPASITVPEAMLPLVHTLAGCDPTAAATAGADRLSRLLVARWLSVAETQVDTLAAGRMWQARPRAVTAHFERLTAAGYGLSDAEQRLYTQAQQLATDQDTDDDMDDGDQVDAPDIDEADETEDDAHTDLPDGQQPTTAVGSDESAAVDTGRDEVADAIAQLTGPDAA